MRNKKSQSQQSTRYFLSLKLGNNCCSKVFGISPCSSNNKAQVWGIDIFIAIIIFIIGIIILYVYSINYVNQANDNIQELLYQGNNAADILLGPGGNGIISNNSIDQAKLDEYYLLDYEEQKINLGLVDDYYFVFEEMEANGESKDYIGLLNSSSTQVFIKINRIALYKNKVVKFELYLWR